MEERRKEIKENKEDRGKKEERKLSDDRNPTDVVYPPSIECADAADDKCISRLWPKKNWEKARDPILSSGQNRS